MHSPERTLGGPLHENRANAREAAIRDRFTKEVATVVWDFAADGGALGVHRFYCELPPGAVVTEVYTSEQIAVVAATSMTLSAGGTALTGAVNFTGTSGVMAQDLAGAQTAIKPSATGYSELTVTLASVPATAGRVRWCVEFYVSRSDNL